MVEVEDPVREELRQIAADQERLRDRLAALVAQRLAPADAPPLDEDLPEQADLATERRSIVECILHDLLPVIDDLRAAADYRPGGARATPSSAGATSSGRETLEDAG